MKNLENMSAAAEGIITLIIDHVGDLKIKEKLDHDAIVLNISMHKDDVGKVIGRKGKNVDSLRVLLKAIAVKNFQKRLILVVNEES